MIIHSEQHIIFMQNHMEILRHSRQLNCLQNECPELVQWCTFLLSELHLTELSNGFHNRTILRLHRSMNDIQFTSLRHSVDMLITTIRTDIYICTTDPNLTGPFGHCVGLGTKRICARRISPRERPKAIDRNWLNFPIRVVGTTTGTGWRCDQIHERELRPKIHSPSGHIPIKVVRNERQSQISAGLKVRELVTILRDTETQQFGLK
jgi:hypothetical protein